MAQRNESLDRILVITPTYNEAENLAPIIKRLRDAVPSAHSLIADDNSPDGTGAIADRMAAEALVRSRPGGLEDQFRRLLPEVTIPGGPARLAKLAERAFTREAEQQMPLSSVLNLKVGDTLMLNATPESEVSIRAGSIPLTTGRMGRKGQFIAVRVEGPVNPETAARLGGNL